MKILILPDGQGWVVDRNCQALVESLPEIDFTINHYTRMSGAELIREANAHDLVHYFNYILRDHWGALESIQTPMLMSIRSHRYPPKIKEIAKNHNLAVHVVNQDLLNDFPQATYIPNGIFNRFKGNGFTVGYGGHYREAAKEYDGYYLIKKACEEMGVTFLPALSLLPEKMPEYYKSIDLYVCASEAEGFSTGVMECLAMNVPVISVDTGVARHYVPYIIERSVEGIKRGIQKYYTQELVSEYRWDKLAPKYKELYETIHNSQR